ncbi:MAG: hypothetical protein M3Y84_15055 [Acidobacteriota bacterium]|nr:hypothetical protein [Acidobacteriota bacterium]
MITGFNTDIEHNGVVYHVQTEDKGLASPLILSLVYSGGAILASKRTPYQDLISSGFDEEVLAQRLQRQHRLICAAVNAGRLEDLKRMNVRSGDTQELPALPPRVQAPLDETLEIKREVSVKSAAEAPVKNLPIEVPAEDAPAPRTKGRSRAKDSAYTVYDPRRQSPLGEAAGGEKGLVLTILDEHDFRAGKSVTFNVLLQNRSGRKPKPLEGVTLSVKIVGTTFRPQLHTVKTKHDGIAVVSAKLPKFTSGRAAILIRAEADGHSTEMRRVIHPAK